MGSGDLDHFTLIAMRVCASRNDSNVSAADFVQLVALFAKKVHDDALADSLPEPPAAPEPSGPVGDERPRRRPSEISLHDRVEIVRRVSDHRVERLGAGFKHLRHGFLRELAREFAVSERFIVTIDLAARHAAGLPVDSSVRERFKRSKVAVPATPKSDAGTPPAAEPPGSSGSSGQAASQTSQQQPQEERTEAPSVMAASDRGGVDAAAVGPPAPPPGDMTPEKRDELLRRIAEARQDAAALSQTTVPGSVIARISAELGIRVSVVRAYGEKVPSVAEFARQRAARKSRARSTAARMDAAVPGDRP